MELSEEELQELEAEGAIDYVAYRQREPDKARFDEASKDFIFKGEKRLNAKFDQASRDYTSNSKEVYKDYGGASTDT